MRRRVNAGRRSTRRSVQIVVGVTLAFVGGLVLFNRSYLEPYDSPVGQIVLLVVIAIFAVAFAWLRRLSRFEVPGRFLTVRAASASGGWRHDRDLVRGRPGRARPVPARPRARAGAPGVAAALGAIEAGRQGPALAAGASTWQRARFELGSSVRDMLAARGFRFTSLRQDLAILDMSFEGFLATKVIAAAVGFVAPLLLGGLFTVLGFGLSPVVPLWLSILVAAGCFFLPDMSVRSRAADARRDFRHVVGSFLDLVAMNLAGGRGVPEALMTAAAISDGWAMRRIRAALEDARLRGVTPWAALGELGEQLAVDELRDLAAALALVAEDGAKVRTSLAARATSLRRRDLADVEGRAQERSQSMLVAQLLLCAGFLLFLTYPAVVRVLGA